MAIALEVRQIPEVEIKEGLHYDEPAAKILAVDYLTNKGKLMGAVSDDTYLRGKMEVREKILSLIGQDHLIHMNIRDPYNPPLVVPLRPIPQSEIDKLIEWYKLARQKSGREIRRLTPDEAINRGIMIELGKSLINLGQRSMLDDLNGSAHQSHNSGSGAELQ